MNDNNIALEQLRNLVNICCDSTTNNETRNGAEKRLHDIQNDDSSWLIFLDLLSFAEENLLFFIGQGLLRAVWKLWSTFNPEDQSKFSNAILSILLYRKDLSVFVRSKIEQILGAICANAVSLSPALHLVSEAKIHDISIGFSALRTSLEIVLDEDDPRIYPSVKVQLRQVVSAVVLDVINLTCEVCSNCLQSGSAESPSFIRALELMSIIVNKLQLGSHISMALLQLLFRIIENGISAGLSSQSSSSSSSDSARGHLLSIEILTEIMHKKYLPRGSDSQTDSGAEVLLELVSQTIRIFYQLRTNNILESSSVTLPFLLFLRAFIENHFERCFNILTVTGRVGAMTSNVMVFLNELVQLSVCCRSTRKIVAVTQVWEALLEVLADSNNIDNSSSSSSQVLSLDVIDSVGKLVEHLLLTSLLLRNTQLAECISEIEDDGAVDPLTDAVVKPFLLHLLSKSSDPEESVPGPGDPRYADGQMSEAYHVIVATESCLTSLVTSSTVCRTALSSMIHEYLQSYMNMLLDPTSAAAQSTPAMMTADGKAAVATDTLHLLKCLSLCVPPQDIIPQILSLLVKMLHERWYARGPAFVNLLLGSSQLTGQLLVSMGHNGVTVAQSLLPSLLPVIDELFHTYVSPLPSPIAQAVGVLTLKTCMMAFPVGSVATVEYGPRREVGDRLVLLLQNGEKAVAAETYTLLSLSAALCLPPYGLGWIHQIDSVGNAITCHTGSTLDSNVTGFLGLLFGRLHSLIRLYGSSTPVVRQSLSSSLASLKSTLPSLASFALQLFRQTLLARGDANGTPAANTALGTAGVMLSTHFFLCRQAVALAGGALECLGITFFGEPTLTILNACRIFLCGGERESEGSTTTTFIHSLMLQEGDGSCFTKQILRLSREAVTSLGRKHVAYQVECVTGILVPLATLMMQQQQQQDSKKIQSHSHSQRDATLLQDVVRTSWHCASAHWKLAKPALFSAHQDSGEAGAYTVQPIVTVIIKVALLSLDASAGLSPQDSQVCVEKLLALDERHGLFAALWFLESWWQPLLHAGIKAIVLRTVPGHSDIIDNMLTALFQAEVKMKSATTGSGAAEYFWQTVGSEVITIANQYSSQVVASTQESLSRLSGELQLDVSRLSSDVLIPLSANILRCGGGS